MDTRTINIALQEQSPKARTLKFLPDTTGADGELLLNKYYSATTESDGTGTIDLPVKSSGTIRYKVNLPTPTGTKTFSFYLSAGSDIDLSDLIAAGGAATDSVVDFTEANFLKYSGEQSLTDGEKAQAQSNIGVEGLSGSVLFFGLSGALSSAPSALLFDFNTGKLKLGDTSYIGGAGGYSGSQSFLQVGFDTAYLNNSAPVYGILSDVKRSQTSGAGQQTSGIRPRAWLVQTGGSATSAVATGCEAFASNQGSTVQSQMLQGSEGIAQAYFDTFFCYGGFFQAAAQTAGGGTAINTLGGVRSNVLGAAGWTITHMAAFESTTVQAVGTITNLYGQRFSGWSGAGAVNSYVVYADDTTRRGTSEAWFLYSTSLAPSLLSGGLQLAEQTAPSNPAANRAVIYAEDNGSGKTRLMVKFPTGDAIELAIEV